MRQKPLVGLKEWSRSIGPDALGAGNSVTGYCVNTLHVLNESIRKWRTVLNAAQDGWGGHPVLGCSQVNSSSPGGKKVRRYDVRRFFRERENGFCLAIRR